MEFCQRWWQIVKGADALKAAINLAEGNLQKKYEN